MVFGTLDVLRECGLTRIKNGTAYVAQYRKHAAIMRSRMRDAVAIGLLKINPDFLSIKPQKTQIKKRCSSLQISPKLMRKCCLILH